MKIYGILGTTDTTDDTSFVTKYVTKRNLIVLIMLILIIAFGTILKFDYRLLIPYLEALAKMLPVLLGGVPN
jgi:hypothetical protein